MLTLTNPSRRLVSMLWVASLAAAACVLQGCVVGGDSDDSSVFRSTIETSRPIASKGKLGVQSRNGSIIVRKASDGQLRVEAKVKSKSQGRVKDALLQIDEAPSGVTVSIAWPDKQWHQGDGASIEIWTPDASGLELTTGNGDVEASGFSGKALVTTSNATIRINDHAGDLIATTSNGEIIASRITGSTDAGTSNSDITLRDVAGPVTAVSSNGDITVSLASGSGGPVKARTSNAGITLLVSPAFAGSVQASTSNGNVECLVPRAGRSTANSSSATFSFGAGSTSTLETSNGNITVKSK